MKSSLFAGLKIVLMSNNYLESFLRWYLLFVHMSTFRSPIQVDLLWALFQPWTVLRTTTRMKKTTGKENE